MGRNSRKDCVLIESGGSPIYLGSGAYPGLEFILGAYEEQGIFILVDEHTERDCLPYLLMQIQGLQEASVIRIPSGEEHKDLKTCSYIWQELLRQNASRGSLLINLGGGVITDMGGFVAATYKRGMDHINIPTSLMGQIDAAIGGKTGVDFRNVKNQIGLFAEPRAVVVDPTFLRTLSKREFISGFAELVKYALITEDDSFRRSIQQMQPGQMDGLAELIEKAIRIKTEIAQKDRFDQGERKKLNFGHTVGHALEAVALGRTNELRLLHGEAVAYGMICEAFISYRRNLLSNEQLDWITELLNRWFTLKALDEKEFSGILNLMRYDKKNHGERIMAVLIDGKGACFLDEELNDEEILDAFRFFNHFLQLNSVDR
jgi:3-dehydroquinate synthase